MANIVESRLTFIKIISGGKHPRGLYRCVCGTEKEIIIYTVNKGQVVSCGCYHKERTSKHLLSKHPLYSAWANIKDRCCNKMARNYRFYGGRGVSMCNEWMNDFKVFYDWCIANGWKRGMQIDKDIKSRELGMESLLYSPDMCLVVTSKSNNNSKANSKILEYKGVNKTVTLWSEEFNLNVHTFRNRLKRNNWVITEDLIRPARFKTK